VVSAVAVAVAGRVATGRWRQRNQFRKAGRLFLVRRRLRVHWNRSHREKTQGRPWSRWESGPPTAASSGGRPGQAPSSRCPPCLIPPRCQPFSRSCFSSLRRRQERCPPVVVAVATLEMASSSGSSRSRGMRKVCWGRRGPGWTICCAGRCPTW
ncbi:unnamed protein product, partial [Ectocarpus sp. 4 AP-2014]